MIKTVAVIGFILLLPVDPVSAQARAGEAAGVHVTRSELQGMLERYAEMAESEAYSRPLREHAGQEATLIRQRLDEGDLRVGDQVLLVVEGHVQLSDTFRVVTGRRLILPELGDVELDGVLRSELQAHLAEYVARFIRDPTVHARALIRLQITGAVAVPGFYTVPSDNLLTDALMMAGGPAPNAQLDKLRIERGNATIWDGDRLQEAVLEGRTLDQLDVRAGDGIHVPMQSNRMETVRTVATVLSTLAAVVLLVANLY